MRGLRLKIRISSTQILHHEVLSSNARRFRNAVAVQEVRGRSGRPVVHPTHDEKEKRKKEKTIEQSRSCAPFFDWGFIIGKKTA